MDHTINTEVPPSGTGCVECLDTGSWWMKLRRCAACGHVGCCDSSPDQHGTGHYKETGHRIMQSFEPGEDWMWDFETESAVDSVELAPPHSRPDDQPSPGPAGKVPDNWRELLRQ